MVEKDDTYLITQNHEIKPEQNEKDLILANLDVRINILCDQIIFNPSDETVTITSCQLQRSLYTCRDLLTHPSDKLTSNRNVPRITKDINTLKYTPNWPSRADVGDVICLGSTVIIIIVLLSVFILYLSKDYENKK